jgi:hypothetical protein
MSSLCLVGNSHVERHALLTLWQDTQPLPAEAAPGEEYALANRLAARGANDLPERAVNRHLGVPCAGGLANDFADALRHRSHPQVCRPRRSSHCSAARSTSAADSSPSTSRQSVRNVWRAARAVVEELVKIEWVGLKC